MKKKILYVLNYITNSGPSNVLRNLISCMNPDVYDISLITLFPENNESIIKEVKDFGVNVMQCTTLSRMGCILGLDQEFKQYVTDGDFDIIHTHGFIADILASRLKIHAKRVSTIHNNMFEDYVFTYGKLKSRIFIPMHIRALRKLEYPVCCSKSSYDALKDRIPQLTYIRNGISVQHSTTRISREELGIPADAMVYIYAGVLSELKRTEWLIRQFVRIHNDNEYLLVLGDGEKRAACEAAADGHVRMLGYCLEPTSYMDISDIYISASSSEGFSMSVLEALNAGLGLFLSDIPSHCEVMDTNQKIYLGEIFSQTEADFEQKMLALRNSVMNLDKTAIKNYGTQNFSKDAMARQYQKMYEQGEV